MLELMVIYLIVSGGIALTFGISHKLSVPIKYISKKIYNRNHVFPENVNI